MRDSSPRMVLACAFLAIVSVARGRAGEAPTNDVIVQFPIDPYWEVPHLTLTFDGVDYQLLADTGSTMTSFDSGLSSLLIPTGREAVMADANATATVPLYRAPQGQIGNMVLPRLETVGCYDHNLKHHIATRKMSGIIGMDALHHFILRIDFDSAIVSILRSVPADAGARLELDQATGRPIVNATLGDRELTFVVDTGSNCYGTGRIDKRDFDELVARGSLSVVDQVPVGTDFGVGIRRAGVSSVPFVVGRFRHAGLVFCDFERRQSRQKNTLGIGFLRRYTVTFDFPGRAVYLAPGRQFHRIDASHDPGGVRLSRDGGRIVVSHVAGPALEIGIQVGDTLEKLNGVDVRALDAVGLPRLLSSTEKPACLVFQRAGNGRMIRFTYDESEARRRSLERLEPQKEIKPH
jgi:hypothetical protein